MNVRYSETAKNIKIFTPQQIPAIRPTLCYILPDKWGGFSKVVLNFWNFVYDFEAWGKRLYGLRVMHVQSQEQWTPCALAEVLSMSSVFA